MPVSGARAGPSLVWVLSCQGDPYLPSLVASGSSDTAILYPVQATEDGLDQTGTHFSNILSTDINGMCNYRMYTGKQNQLNPQNNCFLFSIIKKKTNSETCPLISVSNDAESHFTEQIASYDMREFKFGKQ